MTKNSSETLSIGEVAKRSGVSVATVRFYESKGLLEATRTTGGSRVFPRHVLRRVAMIRLGVQFGIPLKEIRAIFATLPTDRPPSREDWQHISTAWNAEVEHRLATLADMRDKLTDCIGCGCLSLGTCSLLNPDDALGTSGSGPRRVVQ